MASLGQELKRERELRGISLQEISNSTKISMRFLQALEEDRLDVLPGKFFIKSIISAYAKVIGLEEDSVLNKYYETLLDQGQIEETESEERKTYPGISLNIKKFLDSSVLIVLLIVFLCFIFFFFSKKRTYPPPEEPKASTLFQEVKPAPPLKSIPQVEAVSEEKELNLEISFAEETWIQVYADGELRLEETKQPGEKITIVAQKELLLHLGNAGGVLYSINNKEGKPLGISGQVIRNIIITLENYQQFLVEQK